MKTSRSVEYTFRAAGFTTTPSDETALENKVLSALPEGKLKILEVGSGNGKFAIRLASLGHDVTAIDTSETGIAIARKTAGASGPRFEHVSADDGLKQFRNFDVVVSKEVIEHLYSPKTFLRSAYAVLRPGGVLVVTTPYHGYLKNLALSLFNGWDRHLGVDWEGGHIKFFSVATLRDMVMKEGFVKPEFTFQGRLRFLSKAMICRARKG